MSSSPKKTVNISLTSLVSLCIAVSGLTTIILVNLLSQDKVFANLDERMAKNEHIDKMIHGAAELNIDRRFASDLSSAIMWKILLESNDLSKPTKDELIGYIQEQVNELPNNEFLQTLESFFAKKEVTTE